MGRALSSTDGVVNVLLFDDFLCGRLFTEDLWAAFPTPRLRLFTPNVKREIVDALAALPLPRGVVVGGCGCYHGFLSHWEALIARTGGRHAASCLG